MAVASDLLRAAGPGGVYNPGTGQAPGGLTGRGMGGQHFASLGYVMAACVLIGTAGPIVQFLV